MSISSSIYAEYANKVKDGWTAKLREINNTFYDNEKEHFIAVRDFIQEMEQFEFGE